VHQVATERSKNLPPCTTELPPDDVELPDVVDTNDCLFSGKGNGHPPLYIKEMHYNYKVAEEEMLKCNKIYIHDNVMHKYT
jgi:hypothetical protein